MMTLFKKEFLSYFRSSMGYFILGIYAVVSMIMTFYLSYFFQLPNNELFSFFYYQPQVLTLIAPALTMRLWAEEKRSGTIEFLLTQPLEFKNIVAAKFLAALSFGTLMLSLSLPFVFYCAQLTDLDVLNIISNYIATFLVIGAFCAIGCAVSGFNTSSVTAYLITFFICWIISFADFSFITKAGLSGAVINKAIQSLNFYKHYSEFLSGQIGLDNIIYFVGITFFSLWINLNHIEFKKKSVGFISLSLVSMVLINICSGILFGSFKSDFTDNKKYTLSQGSIDITNSLEKKIYAKVYISSNLSTAAPIFGQYSQFVTRFLEQYQKSGKIEVEIKTITPYSYLEQEAKDNGIKGIVNEQSQSTLYFGAVFYDEENTKHTIPSFIPERQAYLEHDISRIIHKFTQERPTSIGLIAPQKVWEQQFVEQLKNSYNLLTISPDVIEIPQGVRTVILVNPGDIHSYSTYALEQYLMRGGRLLVFLDSFSEHKANLKPMMTLKTPGIKELFKNLGLEYFPEVVAGDINLSQIAIINNKAQNFAPWIDFEPKNINQKSNITKGLSSIVMHSPTVTAFSPSKEITKTSLLHTSDAAGMVASESFEDDSLQMAVNFYEQNNVRLEMGLLLEGKIEKSLFEKNPLSGSVYEKDMREFVFTSAEDFKLIAINDSDMLFDDQWALISQSNIIDNHIYGIIPVNNNMDIIERSVDYLSNNTVLLNISSKEAREHKSILSKINDKIRIKNAAVSSTVNRDIMVLEEEVTTMLEKIDSNQAAFSIGFSKDIEAKRAKIRELQEAVKYLNYLMQEERNKEVYTIIIINTFVFPAILVLLLLALHLIFRRTKSRKTKEFL